jgi:hypothetical protein
MSDKDLTPQEKMLKALEAKKNNKKTFQSRSLTTGGSKIKGGQRSGGAPQLQRKSGPSSSGSAG